MSFLSSLSLFVFKKSLPLWKKGGSSKVIYYPHSFETTNANDKYPLLLSKFYHQVEAGKDKGFTLRNFNETSIDFRIDGVKITQSSDKFDDFISFEKCVNRNRNDILVHFHIPARYEILISKLASSTTSFVDELAKKHLNDLYVFESEEEVEEKGKKRKLNNNTNKILSRPIIKVIVDVI